MGKHETNHPEPAGVPNTGTSLLIFATIADTTWRLFVPVLGLLGLGIWLDGKYDHKPLFALGGVLLGTLIAFALVYQQYRSVSGSSKK